MSAQARTTGSDVCLYITALFLPFLPVLIKTGPTAHFWINLALEGFLLFPLATIHAWWVLYTLAHPEKHPEQVADITSKHLPAGAAGAAGAAAGAGKGVGAGKGPSRAPTSASPGANGAPVPPAGAGAADPNGAASRDDLLTPAKRSPTGAAGAAGTPGANADPNADAITKAGIPVSNTGTPAAEKADPLAKPATDPAAAAGAEAGAAAGAEAGAEAGAAAGADAAANPRKGSLAKTGATADDTLAKV